MAHTATGSTPPRRKLEIALGVFISLIAIGLIIVTIVALNHPKGRQAANATGTTTGSNTASPTGTATTSPTKTPSPSKTASSNPATSSATTSSSATSSAPDTSAINTGRLPLVVLNNTSSTTATIAAQRFQAGGWTVTDTSTFAGDILSTAVYYDPNTPGAQTAANALQQQFPAIKRVKEKFDGLPSGPLVVVLTSDYS